MFSVYFLCCTKVLAEVLDSLALGGTLDKTISCLNYSIPILSFKLQFHLLPTSGNDLLSLWVLAIIISWSSESPTPAYCIFHILVLAIFNFEHLCFFLVNSFKQDLYSQYSQVQNLNYPIDIFRLNG